MSMMESTYALATYLAGVRGDVQHNDDEIITDTGTNIHYRTNELLAKLL